MYVMHGSNKGMLHISVGAFCHSDDTVEPVEATPVGAVKQGQHQIIVTG